MPVTRALRTTVAKMVRMGIIKALAGETLVGEMVKKITMTDRKMRRETEAVRKKKGVSLRITMWATKLCYDCVVTEIIFRVAL